MKAIFACFIFTTIFLFSAVTYCVSNEVNNSSQIEFSILQKTSKSWDGKDLPKYPDGYPEITIIKVIIPAKTSIEEHKHNLINFGYLVKGNLTVTSESGQTVTLNEGDTIIELVNTWHSAKNEGPIDVEIVVFYLGPSASPLAIYNDA